jgi:beta-fructofuranosidase
MSLPRILSLDVDHNLIQTPIIELRSLRGRHSQIENLGLSNESKRLDGVAGDTLEIIANFVPEDAEAFGLKVRCSEDGRNSLLLRYAHGILNVAGTKVPVPLDVGAERLELHVFLDKSVMEYVPRASP